MKYGLTDTTIQKILQVFIKYPEIEKVLIYGSRAKGNFRNGSDIDLTFIGDRLTQSILFQIEEDIDDLLLPYSFDLSILKNITNSDFIAHVNRVGLVFYEHVSTPV